MANVPKDVIKQGTQISSGSSFGVLRFCFDSEGFVGLKRGFKSAVEREITFIPYNRNL